MGIQMKGQMFLLSAGIIVAILVALRAFVNVSQISSERGILEVALEDLVYKNIRNEIKGTVGLSSNFPRNITDNAIDFLNFTRRGNDGHSLDFRSLFIGILANSTNQTMNITVFQFLRESDLNVTIRLNTSTEQRNSTLLSDGTVWVNNFTFTAGQTNILTVLLPGKSYEKNITIETKENQDVYVGFFDISLTSARATHTEIIHQNIKISR